MLPRPATAVAEIAAAHLDTPAERFSSVAAVFDCAEQHRAVLGLVVEPPNDPESASTWRAARIRVGIVLVDSCAQCNLQKARAMTQDACHLPPGQRRRR
jgi:hypothetical protein